MDSDKRKCDGCALAEWQRTSNGRLHPSRSGRCLWVVPVTTLPNSRYFINGAPTPVGGRIERGHTYKAECPQYVQRPEIGD